MKLLLATLISLTLLCRCAHGAESLHVTWDKSPAPDEPDGYLVHWGKSVGNYTGTLDVGKATDLWTPILPAGEWYFTVLAYLKVAGPDAPIVLYSLPATPAKGTAGLSPVDNVRVIQIQTTGDLNGPWKTIATVRHEFPTADFPALFFRVAPLTPTVP